MIVHYAEDNAGWNIVKNTGMCFLFNCQTSATDDFIMDGDEKWVNKNLALH